MWRCYDPPAYGSNGINDIIPPLVVVILHCTSSVGNSLIQPTNLAGDAIVG